VSGDEVDRGAPLRRTGKTRVVASLAVVTVAGVGVALALHKDQPSSTNAGTTTTTTLAASGSSKASVAADSSSTTSTSAAGAPVSTAAPDGKTSDQRRLVSSFVIHNADLQPKSIVASGTGLFFAQNMMYRHNVMVFDRSGNVVAKIPDTVNLASYGVANGVTAQGSPVEAAFLPDKSAVYVSNYKMYGPGYHPTADDNCNPGKWDDSYVYKINTSTFHIDKVIRTGAVPKFLAVTPDGHTLVVSDWCGYDVELVDTATDTPITRIAVGRHPRGIAITKDSRYAYVAVMGASKVDKIDLVSHQIVGTVNGVGFTPRHLVLSPDDRYLYVSNNTENLVHKIDLRANTPVGQVHTGTQTRSMVLSEDGLSLYVVNYQDGTVSKVRTSDMKVLQTLPSGVHPVGITYDPATRQVWVANYAGTLHVFVDQ
jgi:YVTN family beta-propeller protein